MTGQVLSVGSEDQIYEVLSAFLDGDTIYNSDVNLNFEHLPHLRIHLTGEGFNGTITPTVMKVFIEFQKAIYKSYAQAVYCSDNINKLTKLEKKDLEIIVKVENGSSIFDIDGQKILEKMVVNMAGSLSGEQVVVITLSIGAMFFTASTIKQYLNNRKEIRAQEVSSEVELRRLEQVTALSEQETQRMEILTQIQQREPVVQHIHNYANEVKDEMMKSFSGASNFEIDGINLSGEVAATLVKNKRNESIADRLDGVYRVVSVDSSNPLLFKIKVKNIQNSKEFIAIVQDETLESQYKKIIQRAEWERLPVTLSIHAMLTGEKIKEAVVIDAEIFVE